MSLESRIYVGHYLQLHNIYEEVDVKETIVVCSKNEKHLVSEDCNYCPTCGAIVSSKSKKLVKKEIKSVVGENYKWQDMMVKFPSSVDYHNCKPEEDYIILYPNYSNTGEIADIDLDANEVFEWEPSNQTIVEESFSKFINKYEEYIKFLFDQGFEVKYKFGILNYVW